MMKSRFGNHMATGPLGSEAFTPGMAADAGQLMKVLFDDAAAPGADVHDAFCSLLSVALGQRLKREYMWSSIPPGFAVGMACLVQDMTDRALEGFDETLAMFEGTDGADNFVTAIQDAGLRCFAGEDLAQPAQA